ncbi:hypothetical protein K469DRAFT_683914 [Zopfia rhizophila CBS 207.26]|uniref:Uncharacterized protein n=1 Tax=Zopfia rhizophila CBS 207.26 TaxID=1314779 RepID=A0A6A6D7V7_9PEZI|nr:hypothetical protein K469DRAFT_683914 [Zopfia rhizophila CBS 207.26]
MNHFQEIISSPWGILSIGEISNHVLGYTSVLNLGDWSQLRQDIGQLALEHCNDSAHFLERIFYNPRIMAELLFLGTLSLRAPCMDEFVRTRFIDPRNAELYMFVPLGSLAIGALRRTFDRLILSECPSISHGILGSGEYGRKRNLRLRPNLEMQVSCLTTRTGARLSFIVYDTAEGVFLWDIVPGLSLISPGFTAVSHHDASQSDKIRHVYFYEYAIFPNRKVKDEASLRKLSIPTKDISTIVGCVPNLTHHFDRANEGYRIRQACIDISKLGLVPRSGQRREIQLTMSSERGNSGTYGI